MRQCCHRGNWCESSGLRIQALSGSSVRAVKAGSIADYEELVHGSFRIVYSLPLVPS